MSETTNATPTAGQVLDVPAAVPTAAPEGASAPSPEIEFHIETIQKIKGVDRAAALAELAKDGIAAPAEVKPSAIHTALTAHGETVPALHEYAGVLPHLGDTPPAQVAEIQSTVSQWFHQSGMAVGPATYIASEANRFGEKWAAMSPAQKEIQETTATQTLQSALGDRYEPALAAAREMIHAVDAKSGGKLVPFLRDSGILNHPMILAQIVMHGEKIAAGRER